MSYYDFLCSLAEELAERSDDIIYRDLDSAIAFDIRSNWVWFKANKAALHSA